VSVLLLANLSVVQAQINPAPACTKVKLPGPGLRAFLNTLTPGDVGCLRAGVHGARDTYAVWYPSGTPSAPITLKGYPGESMPTILGALFLDGDNLILSGLLFDGPTGRVTTQTTENPNGEQSQLFIEGANNVEVSHCVIRNNGYHAGIFLANAYNARIIGNYIHDNGRFGNPAGANLDHGIYFASGSGLIANNLIEHNYAWGVHLYPSASNVTVQQNTIIKNGRSGVIIDNDCETPGCSPQPTNNLVVNNIIAFNKHHAFQSSIRLTGATGNVIKNNLFWGNEAGDIPTDERLRRGLTYVNQNNNIADPRFVAASNYRLQSGSPAIDAALSPYTQPDDYDFIPRPQGAASDIGAFEQQAAVPSYEADVTPRSNGNGVVDATDSQQIERFSVGLDKPYVSNEEQRADCAPRFDSGGTFVGGDGRVDALDVQQAELYSVNGVRQPAGGPVPTSAPEGIGTKQSSLSRAAAEAAAAARTLTIESTSGSIGDTVVVNISAEALGDEFGYSFSIDYDSTKLMLVSEQKGTIAGESLTTNIDASNPSPDPLGISVRFGGEAIPANGGAKQVLVRLTFKIIGGAGTISPVIFTSTPTNQATSSQQAQPLVTSYVNGNVTINGTTAASVAVAGRVLSARGRGVSNAVVHLINQKGEVQTTRTNSFGYYAFLNVATGESYVFNVYAKRYQFNVQVITLTEDLAELNFYAQP